MTDLFREDNLKRGKVYCYICKRKKTLYPNEYFNKPICGNCRCQNCGRTDRIRFMDESSNYYCDEACNWFHKITEFYKNKS